MQHELLRRESFINKVLDTLYIHDNTISATSVGSFVESRSLSAYSDIDVVVICNKLTKKFFDIYINDCLNIDLSEFGLEDHTIFVNSTFGPLKFDKEKLLVIHLMVYDTHGHVQHVLKSPFTCLDWERSKRVRGIPLEKICSVGRLQFNDFISSRRSLSDYSNDLDKKFLSYREYSWTNQFPEEILKEQRLDARGKSEFAYHIVKNLINNYYKFKQNRNVIPNKLEMENIVNNIVDNSNKFWSVYNKIETAKNLKTENYPEGVTFWAKNFILKIEKFILKDEASLSKISFVRHAKTPKNDGRFLGIHSNPSIIPTSSIPKFGKFDKIYSSPLKRALETAQIISNEAFIYIDKNLAEINYGNADGMTYDELVANFPMIKRDWDLGVDPKFPEGESTKDVHNRLQTFLQLIIELNKKSEYPQKFCVVTHNVILRSLIGNMFNLPINTWHKITIDHLKDYSFVITDSSILPNISRHILESAYNQQSKSVIK